MEQGETRSETEMEAEKDSRERELLAEYVKHRKKKEALDADLAETNAALEKATADLIEYLTDQEKKSTGKYKDLGSLTVKEPTPRAKFQKEMEDQVFEFIRQEGGAAMIKPTIHSGTFSSFIKELLQAGRPIPNIIEVYYQPSVMYKKP